MAVAFCLPQCALRDGPIFDGIIVLTTPHPAGRRPPGRTTADACLALARVARLGTPRWMGDARRWRETACHQACKLMVSTWPALQFLDGVAHRAIHPPDSRLVVLGWATSSVGAFECSCVSSLRGVLGRLPHLLASFDGELWLGGARRQRTPGDSFGTPRLGLASVLRNRDLCLGSSNPLGTRMWRWALWILPLVVFWWAGASRTQ